MIKLAELIKNIYFFKKVFNYQKICNIIMHSNNHY